MERAWWNRLGMQLAQHLRPFASFGRGVLSLRTWRKFSSVNRSSVASEDAGESGEDESLPFINKYDPFLVIPQAWVSSLATAEVDFDFVKLINYWTL